MYVLECICVELYSQLSHRNRNSRSRNLFLSLLDSRRLTLDARKSREGVMEGTESFLHFSHLLLSDFFRNVLIICLRVFRIPTRQGRTLEEDIIEVVTHPCLIKFERNIVCRSCSSAELAVSSGRRRHTVGANDIELVETSVQLLGDLSQSCSERWNRKTDAGKLTCAAVQAASGFFDASTSPSAPPPVVSFV